MNLIASNYQMGKTLLWGVVFGLLLTMCIVSPVFSQSLLDGDWIVSGTEVVENETITLNGNLIVKPGGSLTLRNVTLTVNSQYDGQYKIEVEPNGALIIEDSEITTANPQHGYAFVTYGSTFEMVRSEIHGVGWGPEQELGDRNAISSGQRGLLVGTENALLNGNTFSNNHVGVILASPGINLTQNTIASNLVHAIYIQDGENCNIAGNTIHHGGTVSSPFRLRPGHNNHITGNTIVSSITRGVIELLNSDGNVIENNDISGLGIGVGMWFVSSDNIVRNNTISVNEAGIMVWGWGNKIEGNTISSSVEQPLTGIHLIYAYNTTVTDNSISGVGEENGLWLRHSSNNLISNNEVSAGTSSDLRPSTGLMLFSESKHNVIHGNTFSDFHRGISLLFGCDDNIIMNNGITSTSREGFIIDDSSNNTIYQNNFSGFTHPSYDNTGNQWDYGGQGNYWDDYGGTDSNQDGIGDAPRIVEPQGVDNYPLMVPITVGSLPAPVVVPATKPDFNNLFGKTITGHEVIENQTIELSVFIIKPGASLTLRNVTLLTGGVDRISNISIQPGGSLMIENSTIRHHEHGNGFQLQPPKGATFVMKDSELKGCGHEWWYGGIQIGADNIVMENNLITGTMISFFGASGGRLINNTITESYQAINLNGSNNVLVSGNTIRNGVRTAINGGPSDSIIKDNIIEHIWENGIKLYGGANTWTMNNEVSDIPHSQYAIRIGGDENKVTGNSISNAAFGLHLEDGAGEPSTVSSNTISDCEVCLEIHEHNGQIAGNTVSNCTLGISIAGSSNRLINNNVSTSTKGIETVYWTKGNVAYNNCFVANTTQAEDNGSNNVWDYGGFGNYWSDYTGTDANSNGIGDTPYSIPPNGIDHYPQIGCEKHYIYIPIASRRP